MANKQKAPPAVSRAALESRNYQKSACDDRNAAVRLVELNDAVLQREEREVAALSDVLTGMQFGAALTDNDGTSEHGLPAEPFYAEPLRFAGPAVAG